MYDRKTGDIGVLRGNGIETTARVYWHNKTTTFVSDIPGEVELNPKLWGWIEFAPVYNSSR